jgi:hypothetical protein
MCMRELTKDFSENEDKNHSDEESRLLGGTTDTSVTNDTNGETGGKTSKTDGKTSTELNETSEQGLVLAEVVGDQDGDDETVNGNDTSHNDGNNVLTQISRCNMSSMALKSISWLRCRRRDPGKLHFRRGKTYS